MAIARYRRARTVDAVKRQISTKSAQRRPHVIAHSFGSYICGWALEKFQDLRFGRIVLIGCVLPRGFQWQRIRRTRPDAFEEVRNDIGLQDSVVWLLRWLGRIVPDMGTSGLFGFVNSPRVVHRSSRAWGPCPACPQAQRRAFVHDIFLAKYRHSDWALGPGHARELWLPYLWGLSPREFNQFIECCRDAAYARQEKFWRELVVAEENLKTRSWTWTQMQPLEAFVAAELERLARRSERSSAERLRRDRLEIVQDAFTFTYLAVAEAYDESADFESASTPERDQILLALFPRRAISMALAEAVRMRQPA
jgi:pimeloyl-ACP methyl ester carboxylesterase